MELSPENVREYFYLVRSTKYGSTESKPQQSILELNKSLDKFVSQESSTEKTSAEHMALTLANGRLEQNKPDSLVNDLKKSSPTPFRLYSIISYTLSLVFQILVIIGNINSSVVIRSTYFLRIDLSNIIPESVPNSVFINSIARTLGLHDFYQVGLWSYSEGYDNDGITYFSSPRALYWFDPVSIILNELLRGATIALPTGVISALEIVRIASHWMFASFLTGACLTFLCIFFAPMAFSHQPRWSHRTKRVFLRSLPITILTFGAALFTIGASVIATVMFLIFKNTFSAAGDLNIRAELGKPMLAFMWIGSGFNLIGWLMQMGTCCGICCCTGQRKAMRQLNDRRWSPHNASEKMKEDRNLRSRFGWRHRVV